MRVDNLIISEKTPGFNRISPKGMTTNVWKKLRMIFFFDLVQDGFLCFELL